MRNLSSLTAETLLQINMPESLYSQSTAEAKREYRALASRWHPDHERADIAPRVFAHVVTLYQCACRKRSEGAWLEPFEKVEAAEPGIKTFRLLDGALRKFKYRVSKTFELGSFFVCDHEVIFEVRREFSDLFDRGCERIKLLRFQNDTMAQEMSQYLPQVIDVLATAASSVLVLRKTPDQLLLADVLAHFNGRMSPVEHVGWILNVLFNIACYLDWAGICHNAIDLETFYVSPFRHAGMLLGGWWYAAPVGSKLSALPHSSLRLIPDDIVCQKQADCRADLELIKAVGRSLLGGVSGAQLLFDSALPPALAHWLNLPSSGRAIADYADFKHQVLPASFGRPRFIKCDLNAEQLYKEN